MDDHKIDLDKELGGVINLDDLNLINNPNKEGPKQNTGAEKQTKSTQNNEESTILKEISDLANEATEVFKGKEEARKKAVAEQKDKKDKQKYIIIGLVLSILLCFSFTFSSCGKKRHHHKGGKTTPANAVRQDAEFSSNTQDNSYLSGFDQGSNNVAAPAEIPTQMGFEANPM